MALDPSGTLLASCSSDKGVNIFHRDPVETESSAWNLCCILRDHVSTVTRVAWCLHREHGPLLATAGADRWIYVYKMNVTKQGDKTVASAGKCSSVRGYEKDVITDVAFIPPRQHHVLLLSTASLDGCVRLYDIQPLELNCVYKITQETDVCRPLDTQRGGITSIAWFPSSVDEAMTLAVGCMNGCFYLYRFSKEHEQFERVRNVRPEKAEASIHHIVWGPSVGRSFQLLVICCRCCVYVVRLNCISPALEDYDCDVFRWPRGAVCAAWSRSATLLYLINDDEAMEMTVLQARDPSDHHSWEEVSQNMP
ncbi:nucleoporin SEH1 [Trypanosoma grayi]|uniref:nucleoporin SEH1 n=1 Tax=Trypanosoma grayi TaxID=71804 RepID=UPI0004F43013|nr:nucleoporin SEH1 [Trypanosoma grayi]KEG14752.1 nucleoporin SEH1 [Trypanosoma grayi]